MKKYFPILFFLLLFNKQYSQTQLTNDRDAIQLFEIASDNFYDLNTKESVAQAEKVLIYALNNNNNLLAAKTYNLLGLSFEIFTDYKRSIEYFRKGIVCATKIKNNEVLGYLYNNIGGIYSYHNIDLNVGTYYFKKAYLCTKNIKNNGDFLVAGLNIGANLIEIKQYEEGKKYLDEIESRVIQSKEADIIVSMYASYATYYDLHKNDYENAEASFLKAINEGKKDSTPAIKMNLLDIYKSFADFYEKYNQPKASVKYLKLYIDLNNEIYIEEQKNTIDGKNKSFRLDLINSRIEKVELENKNYIKKLNYNKYFIIFLSVLVFTFLALMYFLYKNFIKNKKINRKLKRANIELHNAKQKTEEIAKLKNQFMSTVSHELRTPLYGVIGMTEIIENEHIELKDSKYINSLKFSAKYLLSLINDVLSLSKIESENIELNYEDINFKKEIKTIINSLEVIANQYHNKIHINFEPNVPEFIKTDKIRLSQIIINLVSNALKFTKDGSVNIHIFVNQNKQKLNFKIIDTGIGIPQKYIDKVFDKFIQVERNSDEQFQGTGLGLAIVKRFVDLFKGEIYIESEENKGTKITFTIPLIIGAKIEELVVNTNNTLKNINILVVEDNKVNQIVTQKLLEKNNLKCTIAVDGYNAIEILKDKKFDIILMDIHMPGMNGFETTEKIHELGITTPIIALTASDKYELEGDISKYKMNDILVKPFEFIDLQNLIIKYINKT